MLCLILGPLRGDIVSTCKRNGSKWPDMLGIGDQAKTIDAIRALLDRQNTEFVRVHHSSAFVRLLAVTRSSLMIKTRIGPSGQNVSAL